MRSEGKFELSAAGVLLLAVATLAASGVVFLLGIYVGKGMVEQRLSQEGRVVRLPVPTPGAAGKSDEVDVTFWDKLAKGEAAPAPAAVPTPTALETPVRVAPTHPTPVPRPTEKKAEAPVAVPTRHSLQSVRSQPSMLSTSSGNEIARRWCSSRRPVRGAARAFLPML